MDILILPQTIKESWKVIKRGQNVCYGTQGIISVDNSCQCKESYWFSRVANSLLRNKESLRPGVRCTYTSVEDESDGCREVRKGILERSSKFFVAFLCSCFSFLIVFSMVTTLWSLVL